MEWLHVRVVRGSQKAIIIISSSIIIEFSDFDTDWIYSASQNIHGVICRGGGVVSKVVW